MTALTAALPTIVTSLNQKNPRFLQYDNLCVCGPTVCLYKYIRKGRALVQWIILRIWIDVGMIILLWVHQEVVDLCTSFTCWHGPIPVYQVYIWGIIPRGRSIKSTFCGFATEQRGTNLFVHLPSFDEFWACELLSKCRLRRLTYTNSN